MNGACEFYILDFFLEEERSQAQVDVEGAERAGEPEGVEGVRYFSQKARERIGCDVESGDYQDGLASDLDHVHEDLASWSYH